MTYRTLILSMLFSLPVFGLIIGCSTASSLSDEEKEKLDYQVLEGGDELNFEQHLADGKTTIFYFYADWCANCKRFTPELESHLKDKPEDLALVKVDVEQWNNALSEQLKRDYNVRGIPFSIFFDKEGREIGKIRGAHIKRLENLVSEVIQ